MELLDVIKIRVDGLTKFFAPSAINVRDENFSESLLSANALLSSTISEHQQIGLATNRSFEIDNYLDANYLEKSQDLKAKLMCIKSIAPTLAVNFEMLKIIKQLEATIGVEYFKNFPDITNLTEKANIDFREARQSNDLIEESLILAMQRYNTIQRSTTDLLIRLNENVLEIENLITTSKI